MSELLEQLPRFLGGHLRLTVVALALGIGISVPVGVLATRWRWLERIVLPLASIVQTIPGLALLAGMVILLGRLGVGSIGVFPALVALTAYGVLPILRNTVVGIRELDPAVIEAARGVGMTDRERLRMVELPLALPTIVAGVRTSTVWVVGTATLSTPVGAPSLGNYIFSGLQTNNHQAVLLGCVAAAGLALALDGAVRLFEIGVRRGRAWLQRGVLIGFAALLAWVMAGWIGPGGARPVRVGAKTFTEQYILAELIARRVSTDTERPVEQITSLGSAVVYEALVAGDVDIYVDYSGTLWANRMKRTDAPPREKVLTELSEWLAGEGVLLVGPLGFENAYALAMREDEAERRGIRTIEDLAKHAAGMEIGGDYEFFARPEWTALRDAYGLSFAGERSMDASLMYEAVRNADVGVISAFSSDGRISAYDLRVLEDPAGAIPPYDAILLVNADFAGDHPEVLESLRSLVKTIDGDQMRALNRAVDIDRGSIRDVVSKHLEARRTQPRSADGPQD